ncbi:hypothetical protein IOK49_01075 [Fervidicoccus fontis]|uniref:Uncharacterized protein n=2 Tax=Fervidicoccus fontis TaxID=683846 RepID=I0A2U5_FERFK|nr:hypothetical protein [Fervidicoccus fontis]AFH43302.1 hypothetical protein FFONT_1314 [Fervidicoccus fontis Kam940]MBE9390679.1 hypothetical protein [Fervidicoccus fontis]PMB77604.1 MAG: hypothetical protein C0177_02840 [Fervidicoccus fontis]HEW63845.1 hypothetical protein [Fervidicoccus fontis]
MSDSKEGKKTVLKTASLGILSGVILIIIDLYFKNTLLSLKSYELLIGSIIIWMLTFFLKVFFYPTRFVLSFVISGFFLLFVYEVLIGRTEVVYAFLLGSLLGYLHSILKLTTETPSLKDEN